MNHDARLKINQTSQQLVGPSFKNPSAELEKFITRLKIPGPGQGTPVCAFGLRKAGSVLFNRLLAEIGESTGRTIVNLPSIAFDAGISEDIFQDQRLSSLLGKPGYVFSGLRRYPSHIHPSQLRHTKKILLIRDPRDMLVSLFYSDRYSHRIPERGQVHDNLIKIRQAALLTEIDDYVFTDRAQLLLADYRSYIEVFDHTWRIYRYEDVIFQKKKWVKSIADDLSVRMWPWDRHLIAKRNDKIPSSENPEKHIRQVHPENYKRVLKPATIRNLENQISDIIQFHQSL